MRADNQQGKVLECYVSKKQNTVTTMNFHKKSISQHSSSNNITTDNLPSYGAIFLVKLAMQIDNFWISFQQQKSKQTFTISTTARNTII